MGISDDEASYYEGEVGSGRFLVTVHAANRSREAWDILHRHGGYNRETTQESTGRQTAAAARGTTAGAALGEHAAASREQHTHAATSAGGEQSIKLREEQLHATKQPVQAGEVRVSKEVVTEHKTLDVPVSREEVVIERRPVSGQAASSADIRPGEEVRIPVREEQVKVEKEAVVKEEVHVGKRQVRDTEHVGGTVRKEELRVEKEGDVDVRGDQGTPPGSTERRGRSR